MGGKLPRRHMLHLLPPENRGWGEPFPLGYSQGARRFPVTASPGPASFKMVHVVVSCPMPGGPIFSVSLGHPMIVALWGKVVIFPRPGISEPFPSTFLRPDLYLPTLPNHVDGCCVSCTICPCLPQKALPLSGSPEEVGEAWEACSRGQQLRAL